MRRALGGSLNDVVLTVVTGAVRPLPRAPRRRPRATLDFRVMAPVSVRTRGRARHARQPRLGVDDRRCRSAMPDPRQQLERIAARTARAQGVEAGGRRRGAHAGGGVDAVDAARARRAERDAAPAVQHGRHERARARRSRCTCSARACSRPTRTSRSTDGLGLGIALLSLRRPLCWGFNADYDVVPDLGAFVGDVQAAFRTLRDAAAPIAVRAEKAETAPAPPRARKGNGRTRPGVGPH